MIGLGRALRPCNALRRAVILTGDTTGQADMRKSNSGFHGADRRVYLVNIGGEWKRHEIQIGVE